MFTLTKYIVLEDDDKAKPALLFFCLLLCYWCVCLIAETVFRCQVLLLFYLTFCVKGCGFGIATTKRTF